MTSSEIGSGAIFNCAGFSFAITWNKRSIFIFDSRNSSRDGLNILNVQASLVEFRSIKIWLSWNLIINKNLIITKYLQNNRNSASTLWHDIQYIQVEISKANIWGILNSLKKQRNVIKNICVKKRTSSAAKF